MAPIINVSEEVLEHLKGLGIDYKEVETPKQTEVPNFTIDFQVDSSDYILLEGKSSGKEGYPDLWICKYRLNANQTQVFISLVCLSPKKINRCCWCLESCSASEYQGPRRSSQCLNDGSSKESSARLRRQPSKTLLDHIVPEAAQPS